MNRKDVVVGVDIGGTNTVVGFVSKNGKIYHLGSLPTNGHEDAFVFFDRLVIYIKENTDEDFNIKGIGIGAPNANYYTTTIDNPPNLDWGVIDVKKTLKNLIDVPVALTNDANAAALGEMLFGAAKGMKNFVEITLGTGLGSGVVVNGELVYGHDGFAGEIGHTVVEKNGRQCGCGKRGCLETYASASGICRTVFQLLAEENKKSSLRDISFNKLNSKMIYYAAADGDEIAKEAFERTGKLLGEALSNTVSHLSPEAIVLFGGLALAGDMIFKPVKEHLEKNVFHVFRNKVKIIPSSLPAADAAVLGAGALIWKEIS